MLDLATARAVEEASLNAWPAHQTLVLRGWLLRFAEGYTRRANSVNPIYAAGTPGDSSAESELDVAAMIDGCETLYRQQKLPTIFKITPLVQPADLDARLAALGYAREGSTRVRTRSLTERSDLPALDPAIDVVVESEPSAAWARRFADFNGVADQQRAALETILRGIVPTRAFVTVVAGGTPVACGLGVCEHDLLGLFDIVTVPEARGKGHGTQLLLHLLRWGAAQGAKTAYLQVMDSNRAGRALYDKLGFVESYPYWYRVQSGAAAN